MLAESGSEGKSGCDVMDDNANHELDKAILFLQHTQSDTLKNGVEANGENKNKRCHVDSAYSVRNFKRVSMMMMANMIGSDWIHLLGISATSS